MDKVFTERLTKFIEGAQKVKNEYHNNAGFSWPVEKIEVAGGRKYIKLVNREFRSDVPAGIVAGVYAFINTENGDILKPATWSAPAKHARGNIFADDFGVSAVNNHGPHYMK